MNAEYSLFTQSEQYANFYQQMGEEYWIVLSMHNHNVVGGALVVSTHARRGSFLYVPYGPVMSEDAPNGTMSEILSAMKRVAVDERYDFVRVSPFLKNGENASVIFRKAGFIKSPMHVLAEHTWLLDLNPSIDELFASMKKNHRNLIRRCEQKGVTVTMHTDKDAVDRLNNMHDKVAARHGFGRFPRTYIEKEFQALKVGGHSVIFEARLSNGKLDSTAMIVFYGGMASYRHSASRNLDKKLPSSYAIQWEVIKESKKRGCSRYNFWGIAPAGAGSNHPFYGITHFKTGFGGERLDLLPCHDLPITKKYYLTYLLDLFRKVKKKF